MNRRKMNSITQLVLYYIKEHKIKSNRELALLLQTSPGVIAVIKNRLIKKRLLTEYEALEKIRKNKKDKKQIKKSKSVLDIFD